VKSEALIHIRPAFLFKFTILGYFGLFMDILDLIILFDDVFEGLVKFSFKINNKLRLFNCEFFDNKMWRGKHSIIIFIC
jgi:hypothetical protein